MSFIPNQKFAIIGFFLCLVLSAKAQTSFDAPFPKAIPDPPPQSSSFDGTAYTWALGGTIIPSLLGIWFLNIGQPVNKPNNDALLTSGAILLFGGVAIGPSLGQFYEGSTGYGLLGAAGRIVGGGLIFGGFIEGFSKAMCGYAGNDCSDRSDRTTLFGVGVAVITASAIYSLVDTHFAVQRAHERAKLLGSKHFDLYPTLARNSDGSQRAGMMARLSF